MFPRIFTAQNPHFRPKIEKLHPTQIPDRAKARVQVANGGPQLTRTDTSSDLLTWDRKQGIWRRIWLPFFSNPLFSVMCGRPFKKIYGVIDQCEGRSALRGFFVRASIFWLRLCWMRLRMPQNGLFFGQKLQKNKKTSISERFSKNAPKHPDFAPAKF